MAASPAKVVGNQYHVISTSGCAPVKIRVSIYLICNQTHAGVGTIFE
jgi:hypothetical protein